MAGPKLSVAKQKHYTELESFRNLCLVIQKDKRTHKLSAGAKMREIIGMKYFQSLFTANLNFEDSSEKILKIYL